MFIVIAALHALPPIIGAWIAGEKGLKLGTGVGVVIAFVAGAIVYTIPDLIGVAVGYSIAKEMVD